MCHSSNEQHTGLYKQEEKELKSGFGRVLFIFEWLHLNLSQDFGQSVYYSTAIQAATIVKHEWLHQKKKGDLTLSYWVT